MNPDHPQYDDYLALLRTGGNDGLVFHAANDLGYFGESLVAAWDLVFSTTEGILLLGRYKAGLLNGEIDCYGFTR
jgi:hypothetical protein